MYLVTNKKDQKVVNYHLLKNGIRSILIRMDGTEFKWIGTHKNVSHLAKAIARNTVNNVLTTRWLMMSRKGISFTKSTSDTNKMVKRYTKVIEKKIHQHITNNYSVDDILDHIDDRVSKRKYTRCCS